MKLKLFAFGCFFASIFFACDKTKTELPIRPTTPSDNQNLMIYCNHQGTAFDLSDLSHDFDGAKVTFKNTFKYGFFDPIGEGVLRYVPDTLIQVAQDKIDVQLEKNGKTYNKKLIINIQKDLPCTASAKGDKLYCPQSLFVNSELLNILSNDNNCNIVVDKNSKQIISPATRGAINALISGTFGNGADEKSVLYFPPAGFKGHSYFTYRVHPFNNPTENLYANGDIFVYETNPNNPNIDICKSRTKADILYFQPKSYTDNIIDVDILANDDLCGLKTNFGIQQSPIFFGPNYTLKIIENPKHGTLTASVDFIKYTSNDLNQAKDGFSYTINDSNESKVEINIKPVWECNTILGQDFYSIPKNNSINIKYDVLANDFICGAINSFRIIEKPSIGITTIGSAKEINYTPEKNYTGRLKFIYEIETDKGKFQSDYYLVIQN